jgi:hypothetical protein
VEASAKAELGRLVIVKRNRSRTVRREVVPTKKKTNLALSRRQSPTEAALAATGLLGSGAESQRCEETAAKKPLRKTKVELVGIEPTTSCMPCKRSTN